MSRWKQAMDSKLDYKAHNELLNAMTAFFSAVGMTLVGYEEPERGATVVLVDGRVGEYVFCEDSPYYGDDSALCYILFADSTDYVDPCDIVAVLN